MKKLKKVITLTLAALLAFGVLSANAYAADGAISFSKHYQHNLLDNNEIFETIDLSEVISEAFVWHDEMGVELIELTENNNFSSFFESFEPSQSIREMSLQELELHDAAIQELFEERALLLLHESIDTLQLNRIDQELINLGVEFLTESQVQKLLIEATINEYIQEGRPVPRFINVPSSTNNNWTSSIVTLTHSNNVRYDVQRITVTARNSNSSQSIPMTTRTVNFSRNWQAGAVNVLAVGVSHTAGQIPLLSNLISFFDAVSGFAQGISRTTEVSVPHIAYIWHGNATTVFTFVRLAGQPSSIGRMTQVSTSVAFTAQYTIPTFSQRLVNGNWAMVPGLRTTGRSFTFTHPGHNNVSVAMNTFATGGPTVLNDIRSIRVAGPQDTPVTTLIPPQPLNMNSIR